jgi:hypothetical protein
MILNTKIKQPARPLNKVKILMLLRIALKTFVSNEIPTKKSNKCIVYHSTPKKFPRKEEITNTKIDKNPDSYV